MSFATMISSPLPLRRRPAAVVVTCALLFGRGSCGACVFGSGGFNSLVVSESVVRIEAVSSRIRTTYDHVILTPESFRHIIIVP